MTLTPRQKLVLSTIIDLMRESGQSPTVREIGNRAGIRSPNGIQTHLARLERKGFITMPESQKARGIKVVGFKFCPCCGREAK